MRTCGVQKRDDYAQLGCAHLRSTFTNGRLSQATLLRQMSTEIQTRVSARQVVHTEARHLRAAAPSIGCQCVECLYRACKATRLQGSP